MKKNGFTLIELIVSISIIAMVTGIFLANYSSANRRSDLTMTSQKMVADIRVAQNYALGLARYGLSGSTNVPLGGWGVHIDLVDSNFGNKKYLIFADDDGNKVYNSGEADIRSGSQITTLPTNIIIQSITSGTSADITFLPPDPLTTITGPLNTYNQLDIVLKDLKTNTIKTVRVNFLGLVEVID
jgi:prepilin-type N-terminal cleavage/methylation domain-containing protein